MNERGRVRGLVRGGLVGLVVVAVVGWWWAGLGPGGTSPPRAGVGGTAGSAAGARSSGDAASGVAVPSEREIVPAAEREQTQTVRIVDEHGAPVADAEVAWDDAWFDDCTVAVDIEGEFAEEPRRRSGADGTVELPGACSVRFVLARKDSSFGYGRVRFGPFEPVPELTIRPDRTLQARVVGPDGAPRADVPVLLTWCSYASPWSETRGCRTLRSDDHGLVTVWHAQALDHWDHAAPSLELAALVLGAATTTVTVPLDDRFPTTVDLPCAEHGTLRVRAWLADLVPCPWPFLCDLSMADGAPSGETNWDAEHARDGEALLTAIALGRTWSVHVDGFTEPTVRGPVAGGEQVVVDVAPHERLRLVVADLQWPDGQPVADTEVIVNEETWRSYRTDHAGRLTVPLPTSGERLTFRTRTPAANGSTLRPASRTGLQVLDVGEVVLTAPVPRPLLVAGRVLDSVTGVGLAAKLEFFSAPNSRDGESAEADGRFEIHDERLGESVEVSASHPGYASLRRIVPRGSHDVRLAMTRLPQLRVIARFDPEIAQDTMDCELRVGEQHSNPFRQDERPGCFEATFELPAAGPWPGTVLVLAGSAEQSPLIGVPVTAWRREGGDYAVTIDLRGQLENVVARARVGGTAVSLDELWARPVGATAPWSDLAHGDRSGCVARKGAAFDAIAVSRRGFPVRHRLVGGENEIDLPPPATIAVQIVGWPDGVSGRLLLRALTCDEPLLHELDTAGALGEDLTPQPMPRTLDDWLQMRSRGEQGKPLPAGTAEFTVARRGRYLVAPCVMGQGRFGLLMERSVEVDVTTPGQRLDVLLRVDPEQVRAAVR